MADLIPLEVLLGNPERVAVSLSPDGSRIAYLAPEEGVLNVWVQTLGKDDAAALTHDRGRGIQGFFWTYDDASIIYVQDKGGDENWRLYGAALDSGAVRDLTPFDGVQAQVLSVSRRHPDSVIVGLNKDNPQLHDPFRLTLSTGELEKLDTNPGFIGWVADFDQQLRAGVAPTPDGGVAIMVRSAAGEEWRPLVEAGLDDGLTTGPVSFTRDGDGLYGLSSVGANTGRLVRWDLADGSETVVYEDPGYDVSDAMTDRETGEVLAVAVDRDRVEWEAIRPDVAKDLAALAAVAPGDFAINSVDRSQRKWLVVFSQSDGAVSYYVWNRDTQAATFLFDALPALAQYDLAPMEPFSFEARDGLTIHGYVTFPAGVERRALPTVVNIHGGPWARDSWGFNPEVQWLANRGYLCVQLNFRGSTGYGKSFIGAGDKQWGAAMHDDVLDAVSFAIAQGWADPARIAAYGGSYGGYEALVSATTNPDVFACAVDLCGVSNILTLMESFPPYWEPMRNMFKRRVGDPETEHDLLWERSPLSRASSLRIPLLVAQGANDPRVKQAEAEQIVAVLREHGIPHEYLLYEDEGHGIVDPGRRVDFYRHAERFLATHLGGRAA